ncbi:hypothetical protein HWV62_33256 [Athelia sp. TMB]|nr:hypothetical protein HWV62_33256 [Athelia sp. TMB]
MLILAVTSNAILSTSDPPQSSLPSHHLQRVPFFTGLLSVQRAPVKLHVSVARIPSLLTHNFPDEFSLERTPHALHFLEGPGNWRDQGGCVKGGARWLMCMRARERVCVSYVKWVFEPPTSAAEGDGVDKAEADEVHLDSTYPLDPALRWLALHPLCLPNSPAR